MTNNLTSKSMATSYLNDLSLKVSLDIEFLKNLQSKHIARYSFNSLAVVLGHDISLDIEDIFNKIVIKKRGGYCFEHNKLVMNVLSELGFNVRLLMAKVVYNRDVDAARTHRISLVSLEGAEYIVDAGFGHFGARYPVKLELGLEQDQGDATYRIILNADEEYCYQILKDGEFFTLYTFNLNRYTEAECLPAHFYSHKYPEAAFVNNLVVCRKFFNDILSSRNDEYFRIGSEGTTTTKIDNARKLHEILKIDFELDLEFAIAEFLFSKFVESKAS